jgi:hypothetical protein
MLEIHVHPSLDSQHAVRTVVCILALNTYSNHVLLKSTHIFAKYAQNNTKPHIFVKYAQNNTKPHIFVDFSFDMLKITKIRV